MALLAWVPADTMAEISPATMKARRKAAEAEKALFKPLLDDVFEFAIPYRRGTTDTGKGEKRVNRVFDHTAIVSSFRTANTVAQDISPAGQQIFELCLGKLAKATWDDDQQKQAATELQRISAVVGAHFQTGEWDASLAEMCLDLMASTGIMLILPDRRTKLSRFVTVPLDEVCLTSNGYNEVNGIFWAKRWTLLSLDEQFGSNKWPGQLKERLAKSPGDELVLYQDTVFDVATEKWIRLAWLDGQGPECGPLELERSASRTCPFLTPRYFKVPGETMGRGPIMLVMPTVKALNTGKKLLLQAAAIAMLGIYTVMDDGVFNPDNAPVVPAAFWKVARNGGTFGPSINRLQDPRIDLQPLVFKDMTFEIQAGMGDQQLPADGAAVKSATEILERVKRLANDHMGAFGRLVMEIIVPAVRRVMEIAYDFKQLPAEVNIDRLLVDIQVSSPMAMAREAERLQKITRYIEMVVMLLQARAAGAERYVKIDVVAPSLARTLAVPEEMITSADERAKMDEAQQAQMVAAMAAQAAGQDPKAAEAIAGGMAEAA